VHGEDMASRLQMNIPAALLALPLVVAGCGTVNIPADDPDYFPMTRGVGWTYATRAEVCGAGGTIVTNETEVFYEVLDAFDKGGTTAALLSGFPLSMDAWSAITNPADAVMLVCVPASQYHLLDTNALARFQAPEDLLLGLIDENSLILDCPLVTGKRFGEFEQLTRPDFSYCWFVESEEKVRIRGISGVSSWRKHIVYHLVYQTLPAVQHVVFAPGVGIVEYTYHHNGTPCDLRMRLKDFRNPESSVKIRKTNEEAHQVNGPGPPK
jgi:hypothetical protein